MKNTNTLIPRKLLFGNPDKTQARLSPDGKQISYLAPVNGVMNVWVGPANNISAMKPVTDDRKRGIRIHLWAFTNEHILYLQDKGGDENWHVYSVDLKTGKELDLTPIDGVNSMFYGISERLPKSILIGLNDRNKEYHDVYRINISTGDRELLIENNEYSAYVVDFDLKLRFASKVRDDGGADFFVMESDDKVGELFMSLPAEDTMTTSIAGFDKTCKNIYLKDSRGRNTNALYSLDLATGEKELIAENPNFDIAGLIMHPMGKNIQAVGFNGERNKWQILDSSIAEDFDYLQKLESGDLNIATRSMDDQTWIVSYSRDDGPCLYYLYNRKQKQAEFLFSNQKEMENVQLSKMHPVTIKSRDNLDLICYYTLPHDSDTKKAGIPEKPLPLILSIHGGPWARNIWGFNPTHQWLANRGYAVLSINYRGSTGFGKDFINAANKEWSGTMHNDLLDAVDWAIEKKITTSDQVAIMGGSYGGYATLVGLTFTPEKFVCGVDIVGPSNLVTLIETIPPYWKSALKIFITRIGGDHRTPEGREFLAKCSPITYADKIVKPLLIGQGANDPRVKQAESDQIVNKMQEKDIPVTYVLYPDEGHGFARPENRLSFNAITEAFFAENLGGQCEEIGDDFSNSSITVPTGASEIPGLLEKLV
jgi:dipeptidyl aminopeptidase/acylaminoacyl peptidase